MLDRLFPAGDWAMDTTVKARALIGQGDQILWARGEPLITCADTSHGKSTMNQNFLRATIGLLDNVMGMAAEPFKHVLYIAADRPHQIKASLKRMVTEANIDIWNERVHIHEGPLPFALNLEPEKLLPAVRELAMTNESEPFDCVFVDSLKDLVSAMDDNVDGIQINHAFQSLVQNGIELAAMVHPRKLFGSGKMPLLDDISGNKNILNGAGSVVYLGPPDEGGWQNFWHLKPPQEAIGNVMFRMEKQTGNLVWASASV